MQTLFRLEDDILGYVEMTADERFYYLKAGARVLKIRKRNGELVDSVIDEKMYGGAIIKFYAFPEKEKPKKPVTKRKATTRKKAKKE